MHWFRHVPLLLGLAAPLGACAARDLSLGSRCPEGVTRCHAEARDAGPNAASHAGATPPLLDAAVEVECDGACRAAEGGVVKGYRRCVPGHYVGDFYVPEYKPVAAGLCGLATLYGGEGAGTWQFILPESAAGTADTMEVETCLEIGIPNPEAYVNGTLITSMTATLDCETGELSGEFHGAYHSVGVCDLGTTEAWYSVKGFVNALFDPDAMAFGEGFLDMREPASLLPFADQLGTPPGGTGTWQASWRPLEASVSFPSEGCLEGIEYTDFEVQR